jgi:F-type H+-transporting ATPase subunit delta
VKDTAVASRYARALYQAARSAREEDKVRQELRQLHALLRTDSELAKRIEHPLVPLREKKLSLRQKPGGGASSTFDRFLDLLLAKKRMALLPVIASYFDDIVDRENGVVKVQVRSAEPLGPEQVDDLEKRLGRALGGRAKVVPTVDNSLIAGLVVRVGDTVWDRSLKGQLQRLKDSLVEARTSHGH